MNMNWKWLETFISEKGIDIEERIEVNGPSGVNNMSLGDVLSAIDGTSQNEKQGIKKMMVKIDFVNGDIRHYLKHLAQAIAI